MSDWNKRSTNTAYRDEIEAREAESEERTRTILRRAPPYDPLHDNAERLLRAAERVVDQYVYEDPTYDDFGRRIDQPHSVSDADMVALLCAVRAAKGLVGS